MKILLPLDGSAFGDAAVREVASGPWPPSTQVRLLFALELYPHDRPAAAAAAPERYAELERIERARAEAFMGDALARLRAAGLDAGALSSAVVIGPPKRVIPEEADAWGADLVVLGSHGGGFWDRLLLGSVAEAVLRRAPCSVRVVKPRVAPPSVAPGPEVSHEPVDGQ